MFIPNKNFIKTFRQSLPYVNHLINKTIIIAINSHIVKSNSFKQILQDIILLNSLNIKVVIIYGISSFLDDNSNIIDNDKIIKIKKICGLLRFEIENLLSLGFPNANLNKSKGKVISGNFIYAKPVGIIDGIDMQYSGVVRKIDIDGINLALNNGNIVLINPIGYSLSGLTYSIPMADTAIQLNFLLNAEKLIFLTRANGIVGNNGELIKNVTYSDFENNLVLENQHQDVQFIYNSIFTAIKQGAKRVYLVPGIIDGSILSELFTRDGIGTSIAKFSFINIRSALLSDISIILQLIKPLIDDKTILPRNYQYLEQYINEYIVLEYDEIIYGCLSLTEYSDKNSFELGCLVVAEEKRKLGYGEYLLEYSIDYARKKNKKSIFTLTTKAKDWFLERGFVEISFNNLPKDRLDNYLKNNRNSKVLEYYL